MFFFRQTSHAGPVLTSVIAAVAMVSLSVYAVGDMACSLPPVCTAKSMPTITAPPALTYVLA